jgi:four helix bundle protein
MTEPLLPKSGGYRKLISYQKAEAVYDFTYYFCKKYLQRGDRTIDQMIQAARSGKQNIAEGSAASATSKETEIKLMNVAKASLEELLLDYEDYLRSNILKRAASVKE